jgi:hypothetical protein
MAGSRRIMDAFAAAITVALMTGPAAAQSLNMPMGGDSKAMTDEEKEKQAERERAYKDAIRKIPDQKANTDPWGNVRNAGSTQNSQKKTGSNTTGSTSK